MNVSVDGPEQLPASVGVRLYGSSFVAGDELTPPEVQRYPDTVPSGQEPVDLYTYPSGYLLVCGDRRSRPIARPMDPRGWDKISSVIETAYDPDECSRFDDILDDIYASNTDHPTAVALEPLTDEGVFPDRYRDALLSFASDLPINSYE